MKNRLVRIKSPFSIVITSVLFSAALIGLCALFNIMNPWLWLSLMIVVAIIVILLSFIYLKPLQLFKSRGLMYLDAYLLAYTIASTITAIAAFPFFSFLFVGKNSFIPSYVFGGTALVALCLFLFRVLFRTRPIKDHDQAGITLSDAYYGKYELLQNDIFIKDQPSFDDLLNGSQITTKLTNGIRSRIGEGKSIIAIKGKWGAGKTTFIRIALKTLQETEKDRLIICDEFSAWAYEDIRSVFVAIIERIYDSLPIGISDEKARWAIESYVDQFLPDQPAFLGIKGFGLNENRNSIIEAINEYLAQNQKTILFVIDNLDRTDVKTFTSIFTILSDSIELKQIIFLVAFDENYAIKILTKEGKGKEYLDKIVGLSIDVPLPAKSAIDHIGKTILSNYLKKYLPEKSLELLTKDDLQIITDSFSITRSLRELICLLNDLFALLSSKDDHKYFVDYLGIRTIQVRSPDLYQLLKESGYYFVPYSSNYINHKGFYLPEEKQKRKEYIQKEYFDEDKPYREYRDLVSHLFPGFEGNTGYSKDGAQEAEKDQRIYCGKFFSHYFGYDETGFVDLVAEIKSILESDDQDSFESRLKNLFARYSPQDAGEILYQISGNLPARKDIREWLLLFLEQQYRTLDHYSGGILLSPALQSALLINTLLSAMNPSVAKRHLLTFKGKANALGMIWEIRSWNKSETKETGIDRRPLKNPCVLRDAR